MDRYAKHWTMAFTALTALVIGLWLVGFPALGRADEAEKREFAADKGPDTIDVSSYPKRMQAAYKIFASKCSRCHTLARPINTSMSASRWKRYVKRMMNKPDSGISPRMGKRIYQFLKFYEKKKKESRKKKDADDE